MKIFNNANCTFNPVILGQNMKLVGFEGKIDLPKDANYSLLEIIAAIAENYPHKDMPCRLFINLHDFGEFTPEFDDLEIFRVGGIHIYSVLNYIIPNLDVVFITKFSHDYYDENYYPENRSKIIEDVIIKGVYDLCDFSYEVMFDDIGSDECNHALSASWEVASYMRFGNNLTCEESLDDNSEMGMSRKKVLDYYTREINSYGTVSFAGNVKTAEQFEKLKEYGIVFFSGPYIDEIADPGV